MHLEHKAAEIEELIGQRTYLENASLVSDDDPRLRAVRVLIFIRVREFSFMWDREIAAAQIPGDVAYLKLIKSKLLDMIRIEDIRKGGFASDMAEEALRRR